MSIPYLPLFVADYEADTAHLSVAEDGAYMRLLRLQWRTPGCTMPNDHGWIQRRVRATDGEWRSLFAPLLKEFFSVRRGRIYQPRLHAEFERINATSLKRSSAGKKGGRHRKALKNIETSKSPAKAKQKHLEPELDKEREANASPKKAGRIPDDWALSRPLGEWAVEQGASVERVRFEAEQFKDHWLSASGQTASKRDWAAAWRKWFRKALKDSPERPNGGPGNGKPGYATGEHAADLIAFGASFDERAEADSQVDHGESSEPSGPLLPDPLGPGRCQNDGGGLDRGFGGHTPGSVGEGSQGVAQIIPIPATVAR